MVTYALGSTHPSQDAGLSRPFEHITFSVGNPEINLYWLMESWAVAYLGFRNFLLFPFGEPAPIFQERPILVLACAQNPTQKKNPQNLKIKRS